MVDSIETYEATLSEVRRQAAQLSNLSSSGGEEAGGAAAAGRRSGSGSGSIASETSSDWVVLESSTAPPALPTEAAGCSVWPQQQWQIAYEILFCQCPEAISRLRSHQTDDMLFFVCTDEAAAAARTRLFVRRRSRQQLALPADLQWTEEGVAGAEGTACGSAGSSPRGGGGSSKAAAVDWRASVLLMMVLQTAYRLSVLTAADAEQLSAFVDSPGSDASTSASAAAATAATATAITSGSGGVRSATRVVHASPSRVPVNLDNSRSEAGRPQASYPDISFAVDTCDDAFQSQVLRKPADCYCVLLHAEVAASWRLPAAQAASSGAGSSRGGAAAAARTDAAAGPSLDGAAVAAAADLAGLTLSEQQSGSAAVGPSSGTSGNSGSQAGVSQMAAAEAAVVFSGYVSHEQLRAALGSQLSGDPLRQVLRAAAAAARGQRQQAGDQQALATCRVSMKGPGGKGAADVAVSSYPLTPDAGHLPGSPAAAAEQGPGRRRSSDGSTGSRPKFFERAQLLAKGVAAAAKQAAAQAASPKPGSGGAAGGGAAGGGAGEQPQQLQLKCGLMSLMLPVDMLADSILQAL